MKTVFIVDDNNANLYAAQAALSKQYNVLTMPSAATMFELLEKVSPDLILIDLKMPDMNGFEAIEILKKSERHSQIPIVLLTGQIDAETEVHGFELGAVDVVPKPFSGPALLSRVKSHLEIEELIHERTQQLQKRVSELQQQIDQLRGELK